MHGWLMETDEWIVNGWGMIDECQTTNDDEEENPFMVQLQGSRYSGYAPVNERSSGKSTSFLVNTVKMVDFPWTS